MSAAQTITNLSEEHRDSKLEFGKYRGWKLRNVPSDYLEWLVKEHSSLAVRDLANIELLARKKSTRTASDSKGPVKPKPQAQHPTSSDRAISSKPSYSRITNPGNGGECPF